MKIWPTVRDAEPQDVNHLMDIDIKCFDYCWSADNWRLVASVEDVKINVAVWYGTPIGFAVTEPLGKELQRGQLQLKNQGRKLLLAKLAVKPNYRNRGVGESLLGKVCGQASQSRFSEIEAVVSETMCEPTVKRNAATWLQHMKFKATGVQKHFVKLYGQYEDGYKFELEVCNDH